MASSGASLALRALLVPAHAACVRRAAWATAPIDPIRHPAPGFRSSARAREAPHARAQASFLGTPMAEGAHAAAAAF